MRDTKWFRAGGPVQLAPEHNWAHTSKHRKPHSGGETQLTGRQHWVNGMRGPEVTLEAEQPLPPAPCPLNAELPGINFQWKKSVPTANNTFFFFFF